jgi:hypothetical protein
MDNQKVLSIYNEFSEGKFLDPAERMKFPDRLMRFKRFFKKGFPMRRELNGQKQEKLVNFVDQVNPTDVSHIVENLLSWVKDEELEPKQIKDIAKMVLLCPQIKYFQASRHFKVKDENIFAVSKRIFDYFKDIAPPENLTYKDISFPGEMPALFIFEETGTVVYLNEYGTPDPAGKDLVISIYGDAGIHKHVSMDIMLGTTENEPMANDKINKPAEFLVSQDNESNSERYQQYLRFFINLSQYMSSNENLNFVPGKTEPEKFTSKVNLKGNRKSKGQALSFKYIDIKEES